MTVKDIPRSAVENVKGDKPDPTNEFDNQEGDGVENDNEESHPALTIPDSMPEDAIFIPLGFVHQRPPTFYKGNDPEWQAFVEFSKDRTKVQQIQSELCY